MATNLKILGASEFTPPPPPKKKKKKKRYGFCLFSSFGDLGVLGVFGVLGVLGGLCFQDTQIFGPFQSAQK